ncbi:hypothetical protein NQ314_004659 [Rhamnusium bicolor]|uniref:Uncharacterized protein n=1 Tax=Rhamnusium bicolor TaxID=1586634 RepID=A0AAV8ZKK4_9CUCU|nr:hypothetical protein NQ314_004659 [Rhamnusium bicolor]
MRRELEKKNAENVIVLLNTDLQGTVNKTASESLLHQKRQKKVILPDDDIKKLNIFLLNKRNKYYKLLTKNFSYDAWIQLARYNLILILLFNRRRPGELERIFLSDYDSLQNISQDENTQIYNQLTKEGKQAADFYLRFSIRSKLARGVPVLIDRHMKECLDLLIRYRQKAEIDSENPYLFARPQTQAKNKNFKYIQASIWLRQYSL